MRWRHMQRDRENRDEKTERKSEGRGDQRRQAPHLSSLGVQGQPASTR